jgi:adenylate kinase family enzyme
MKKLVLISGAPGVGKTTLCSHLFKEIQGCAWLDSDWCWMINPWKAKTKEQKKYVEDTFTRILRGYLNNEDINTVLFSWVMSSPRMFGIITEALVDIKFDLYKIALVCDRDAHIKRMRLDKLRNEQVELPDSMEPYYHLGAEVIDVSTTPIEDVVQRVIYILNKIKGE